MPKSLTIIDQFDGLVDGIRTSLFAVPDPTLIDWPKVKDLLGKFLQAFGPVILQILISMLVSVAPDEK
jgi:hypothetical protein